MLSVLTDLAHVADVGTLFTLACIYLTASVFSGLSGFGFSAIGCLSLLVLPPQRGVVLLMALSLATQASSFRKLWPELHHYALPWRRPDGVLPYLVGGTFGIPIGLLILTVLNARQLTIGLGCLLIAYSLWSLLNGGVGQSKAAAPKHWRSFVVGAVGGMVGGFSAFPGSALVVWNGLRGAGKEEGRALTQPYILWMQIVGVVGFALTRPRLFDVSFWAILASALPTALLGNTLGVAIYRSTGDLGYRRITLAALGISGLGLVVKVMLA